MHAHSVCVSMPEWNCMCSYLSMGTRGCIVLACFCVLTCDWRHAASSLSWGSSSTSFFYLKYLFANWTLLCWWITLATLVTVRKGNWNRYVCKVCTRCTAPTEYSFLKSGVYYDNESLCTFNDHIFKFAVVRHRGTCIIDLWAGLTQQYSLLMHCGSLVVWWSRAMGFVLYVTCMLLSL